MREEERKLIIEEIGYVKFRKNNRAKRLTIRIKNDGQINVTIPYLVSVREAVLFVNKKKDWILKIQEKLKHKRTEQLLFNEQTDFSTVNHKVSISRYPGKKVKKKLTDEMLFIQIPFVEDIGSQYIQTQIKQAILDTWHSEAKDILIERTQQLAAKNDFRLTEVKIKNMKTRWGSCSRNNTINLNLHLVRLPDHLRDYIILHELVHTIYKNHGKEFWKRLNELSGNAKELSKELKNIDFCF